MGKRIRWIIGYAMILSGCTHQPVIPDSPAISFSKEIQPLIIGQCTQSGCHSEGGTSELFPLTTYDEIMKHGKIKPGNAHSSRLYEAITADRTLGDAMPPDKPMDEDNIQRIYLWIMQGAKNN